MDENNEEEDDFVEEEEGNEQDPDVTKKISKDGGHDEDDDDDKEEEVTTRNGKTAKDFIIQRQQRKAEKKVEKKEDDDDDGALTEDSKSAVDKLVNERLSPIEASLRNSQEDTEIKEIISNNPEFAEVEKTARKYAKHEAYKDVSLKLIFKGLMYDKAERSGALKYKNALRKSNRSHLGGSSNRNRGNKEPDYKNMSDEEFDKVQRKTLEEQ